MTEDRHFHLVTNPNEPLDIHSLEVRKVEEDHFIMHSNGRCLGFSRHMAEQLYQALWAVLSDEYDIASTETWDRLEFEKQRAKTLMEAHPTTRPKPLTPELDDL